jgi:HAD superfamily hydrolase (TIGR01484 family)
MIRPRLIALDIDGVATYDNKEELYLPLVASLDRLKALDVLCTFITGRGYYRTKKILADKYIPNCPLVLENGGRISEWSGKDILYHPFDRAILDKLARLFKVDFAKGVDFFQRDHLYCALVLDEAIRQKAEKEFLPQEQIASIFSNAVEFTDKVKQTGCCSMALLEVRQTSIPFPSDVHYAYNGRQCVINVLDVSKGSGVLELTEFLGIQLSDVLIAGNDRNDIDMFQTQAGWRIAVGEDCPELRCLETSHVDSALELTELLNNFIQ